MLLMNGIATKSTHTQKPLEPIDNKPACMQNGPNFIICVALSEQETYNVFTG